MHKTFVFLTWLVPIYSLAQHTRQTDSLLSEIQKSKDDTLKIQLYETLFYDGGELFYGHEVNLDEKLNYATKALELSNQLNYIEGIATAYNCIGNVYAVKKRYPNTALKNYYAARGIFEQIGDKHGLGGALCNIGNIYCRYRSRYTQAMDTLLAAKKVLEEINDSNFLACTFEKIGSVLFDKKNYTGSMESFDSAKVVFEKCRNKRGLADTYINMAWIYLQQKKYDDAASYATTGLNLANELSCIAAITNAKKCLARIQKLNRN